MNSGRKNSAENLAHLPSSIRNLINDTFPIISNWEYRIACIPLKNDIPLSRLRIVDDLSVQLLGSPQTREELYFSRRARFELNKYYNRRNPDNDHRWTNGRKRWNYLDYLMEQIPGKNGYNCNMTDELPDGTDQVVHFNTDKTINACYYSRFYGLSGADAMGTTKHRRGWSDRNLFAAKTSHKKVSPIEFEYEYIDSNGDIKYEKTISRWSYAIPLEIIYQTPLTKWNPWNIKYINRDIFDYSKSGKCGSQPYDGWTNRISYFTPAQFFNGLTTTSSADTALDNVCAIGDTFNGNNQHPVYASGHRIILPEIANGVGKIRQRYPIFPIHGYGNSAYKEIKALQSIILDNDYDNPIKNPDGFFGDNRDKIYGFEMNLQGGGHQHVIYIAGWKIINNWFDKNNIPLTTSNNIITVESDTRNSHAHTVEIWRKKDLITDEWIYYIKRCRPGSLSDSNKYTDNDWIDGECSDLHNTLTRE